MTDDAATLDLDAITGLDVLAYWQEYGQTFPPGSPFRTLEGLLAAWGSEGAVLVDVDRVVYAWLLARQGGFPTVSLSVFAASVKGLPSLEGDAGADGAVVS